MSPTPERRTPAEITAWCRAANGRQRLKKGARPFGWDLTEEQIDALLGILAEVLQRNELLNLTRITDPDEALERHLLDSLAFGLHPLCGGTRGQGLLDLGTGAGFPGLPLAVVLPAWTVHLVESRGRKLEAAIQVAGSLELGNVRGHHGRLAELVRGGRLEGARPAAVLARAVASLADLVRECHALLPAGGELVCWKSARLTDAERRDGAREAARRAMAPQEDIAYRLGERELLLVRYVKHQGAHERRPEDT